MPNNRPVSSSSFLYIYFAVIILILFISSLPSQAQPESLERYQKQKLTFFERWAIRVNGNAEHMFDTDIDGGGKFNITRLGFNHDATFTATEDLNVTFGASFNYYNFDFSGSQGFAGLRPWRNVIVSNNNMRVNYAFTNNWGVFVTPMISYGSESGAPFWDSFTIGAMAGVSYTTGPNLKVGVGGFVGSRLEDSAIGYPIAYIDWLITQSLRLSALASGARNDFGPKAELSYDLGRGFKVSSSVGYELRRFRLDEKGNFEKGIGEFRTLPLAAKISYTVNKHLTLNTYGGWLFDGSLELEDSSGDRIQKEDFDAAPFLGASITINL
ncbi:MAG: hypothetical protein O7D98_05765 [Candidatus Dadabacteria bacterium]|jgi:hypothetical protein|nr:hypothetical protein [Candidatus Dadabacteria bacterium]